MIPILILLMMLQRQTCYEPNLLLHLIFGAFLIFLVIETLFHLFERFQLHLMDDQNQLQGKSQKRQIQNAKVGLVHNMSAAATSSTVLVLEL